MRPNPTGRRDPVRGFHLVVSLDKQKLQLPSRTSHRHTRTREHERQPVFWIGQVYRQSLPYRHGGKLTSPLCRTCVETEQPKSLTERSAKCNHTIEERQLTGTWCRTPEIDEAVRQGYVIDHIHEVWHFPQKSTELFKKYVDILLRMKQKASGWPSWTGGDPDKRLEYVEAFY